MSCPCSWTYIRLRLVFFSLQGNVPEPPSLISFPTYHRHEAVLAIMHSRFLKLVSFRVRHLLQVFSMCCSPFSAFRNL